MPTPSLPELLLQRSAQLTAGLAGIGGIIKEHLEDFIVEEIPAYTPGGQGEHLYLWIEKRDMGGEFFQRQIAHRLAISSGEIGMAGLKDRRAVTRQWVSVPTSAEARLGPLDGDGIKVLGVSRHSNKLRPGHLRGNRFDVLIRNPQNAANLATILSRIKDLGLPNYYGAQRFGHESETLQTGWKLLHGERIPVGRFMRKLAFSAVQSAIFNAHLSQRLQDGLFRIVINGDVMAKWPAGGMFVSHDVATEQHRFDARAIVHTGPMFGSKMRAAEGESAQREAALLVQLDLKQDAFQAGGKLLEGTRRLNVIYVDDLTAAHEPAGIRLGFTLPAGSYATVLLDEIMKSAAVPLAADGD
jgi:tRNA pseudouridine13 synthase